MIRSTVKYKKKKVEKTTFMPHINHMTTSDVVVGVVINSVFVKRELGWVAMQPQERDDERVATQ